MYAERPSDGSYQRLLPSGWPAPDLHPRHNPSATSYKCSESNLRFSETDFTYDSYLLFSHQRPTFSSTLSRVCYYEYCCSCAGRRPTFSSGSCGGSARLGCRRAARTRAARRALGMQMLVLGFDHLGYSSTDTSVTLRTRAARRALTRSALIIGSKTRADCHSFLKI